MIQRNAAALIPARIIFCVGEGEGELIDTPIDCSLTLFINESTKLRTPELKKKSYRAEIVWLIEVMMGKYW